MFLIIRSGKCEQKRHTVKPGKFLDFGDDSAKPLFVGTGDRVKFTADEAGKYCNAILLFSLVMKISE